MRSEAPAPGPLLRLTIAGGAAATAAVVASAALDLGRGHWGATLVALPLLVAVLIAARLAYPPLVGLRGRLRRADARRRSPPAASSAWADGARWAVGLHVAAAGGRAGRHARRARRLVPRHARRPPGRGATT